MRPILLLATFALAIFLSAFAAASAEKKVALIIGNSVYRHAVTLPNPKNDAALMAATLKDAGFEVLEGSDLTKADMTAIVDRFTETAYDASIALIFYAGHGIQVEGQNYLIPVDAELTSPAHLRTRAIRVDDMMTALPPDPAVSVVILDACRDNPLSRTLAASLPKSRSASLGVGLAPVETSNQSHGTGGVLIAYATDPGAVAMDGKEEHSPYTAALAHNITVPGLEIQSALTRVRAEVTEKTIGRQRPWHNASLGRELFLGGAARSIAPAVDAPLIVGEQPSSAPATTDEWEVEQRLWDEASKRNTIAHYELYLNQHPQGRFASVAALNLDQLKGKDIKLAATSPQSEAALATVNSGSQIRTALTIPDDVKQAIGTRETEDQLRLDRQGRADIQKRLAALGLEPGGADGSFGPSTRVAIGKWQRNSGIVETTYLTPQQHMFLVMQSDPLLVSIKAADKQREKAAARRVNRPEAARAKSVKRQQPVKEQTAKKSQHTQKIASQQQKRKTVKRGSQGDRQLIGRVKRRDDGVGTGAGVFVGGLAAGVLVCKAAGGC